MNNPLAKKQRGIEQRHLLSPFSPWTSLKHDMDSWFGRTNSSEEYGQFDFSPSCDMKENDHEYILNFDIPGIKKEDIKVELENNRLTVQGERSAENKVANEKYYFSESSQGSFMRSFLLPTNVNETNVKAIQENGVLNIKIQKTEPSKTKKIVVQ